MNKTAVIEQAAAYVRAKFSAEGSGHDWWHIYRVWQLAKKIVVHETLADPFVVELAALMHEVPDAKLVEDVGVAQQEVRDFLANQGLDADTIQRVMDGIIDSSFSSTLANGGPHKNLTPEAQIVSDADKLDALGAVGIARTFAYGGRKNRLIHDPDQSPQTYTSAEDYHAAGTSSINHFYEKLLLLKDRMYTETAQKMAQHRHQYLEQFLDEFYAEWEGER